MIYLELFLTFLKIGAFTFGGGSAMIPLVSSEVVSRGWLTKEQLLNFVAVSESTPGPFAVNTATYVGAEVAGFAGALCATLGVVLPSFVLVLIIARFLMKFSSNRYVSGCINSLRPTVVGLIAAALLSLGSSVLFPSGFSDIHVYTLAFSIGVAGIMIFLSIKKLHPILIIVLSGVLGLVFGYLGDFLGLGGLV